MQMRKSGTLLLKILVVAAVLHKCMGSRQECTNGCPYNTPIYAFDSFRLEATSESEPQQFCLTFKRVEDPELTYDPSNKYVIAAPYKVKYTAEDNTIREDSANVTMLEGEINVYFNSRESGEPLPVKIRFVYYTECFVIEQPSQETSYYHVFISGSVTDSAYKECVGKLQQYSGGTVNYLNKGRNCDQVMSLTKPMSATDDYSVY